MKCGRYRSKFEGKVASLLMSREVDFTYEEMVIRFEQPAKQRRYTHDFVLPNGVILEVKGYLTTDDRMKHKWIKEQHPALDIRFVFMNPNNRISPRSKTRYCDWADSLGYPWCGTTIPNEWTNSHHSKHTSHATTADQQTH